jgi:hypothetical protein
MDNVQKHNCINIPSSQTFIDCIADALTDLALFVHTYVASPHNIPHKAYSIRDVTTFKQ